MHLEAKLHVTPSNMGPALVVNRPIKEMIIYSKQRPGGCGVQCQKVSELATGM